MQYFFDIFDFFFEIRNLKLILLFKYFSSNCLSDKLVPTIINSFGITDPWLIDFTNLGSLRFPFAEAQTTKYR